MDQWQDYTIDKCNLPYTCQMTHDRTKRVDSSVVIFHASDLDKMTSLPPLDKDRAWVYHTAEAPHYTPKEFHLMQYSMTYRLDSDFPWGYLDEDTLLPVMESPLASATAAAPIEKEKGASVAWIVSNCKASNDRHHYVKELSRWINVDIYGHCNNNKVFPANVSTVELVSRYHFYLSFENSNCKDYVTEKLSTAYLAGVVPVVDGPSDYGPFIPNTHAVIRTDDFDSPRALADYLNTLMHNKTLYNQYLSFRQPHGVSDRFKKTLKAYKKGQCDLCTLAYERHNDMTSYSPGKKIYLDNTCVLHKHFNYKRWDVLSTYFLVFLAALVILFYLIKLYKTSRRTKTARSSVN
ncbi:hypothetical protein INT47_011339 [Mucor saturninus]|uniref:Fucosyltransferase n=1 Tax=Mucor saturninus TaxID=64648 RepID=A0A8H7RMC0_9FUNG|nr:hypothetical protein INT47_011339 [Mucor saturninus]